MLVPKFRAGCARMRCLAVDDERARRSTISRGAARAAGGGRGSRRRSRARRRARARRPPPTTRCSSTSACRASTASSSRACCAASPARPALIFVSAYESAAVEAFELRALDYLMKPVSRARVDEALDRIAAEARGRPGRGRRQASRSTRTGGGTRLVPAPDVLYLQAHGDYVRVVTADGRYLCAATLGEIERRWEPHGFHRVHRASS
jgi:DNA-binding NtrC family response regulator